MRGAPELPTGVTRVRETRGRVGAVDPEGGAFQIPLYTVPSWTDAFPWLIHGTTGAGVDFGLFGDRPAGQVQEDWRHLRDALGTPQAVHARQVHGAVVLEHTEADPRRAPGLRVVDAADGHVTAVPGILVTVSLADCVPVSLVDPDRRRVALLHGGWRGTAAGIVEVGLRALGANPSRIHAHLGPAICERCYEVGPEVFEALDLPVPDGPTPVGLRAVQAHRLVEGGVPPEQVTVSSHCTLCGGEGVDPGGAADRFYSHRGGKTGRQLGVLALR